MKITKLNKVVFSPTGGTQKAADALGEGLGWEKEEIDISVEAHSREFGSDELVMFAVPSYGGRVPELAVQRIKELRGSHTPAVLIVSYGNRAYDDTLLELRQTVEDAGFIAVAAAAAVTEHSIMHQYGTGRPDMADQEELKKFGSEIRRRLDQMEVPVSVEVPGNTEYREYKGVPLKPSADRKKCTECGLCASRCPAQAIPAGNPSETDTKKCISCMRCISICPQHARSLNKIMLAAASQSLKKACSGHKKNEFF
ncbi:EFR1 family ferrodoxin [Murimonas intestini]|uniref:EFR1 family ferrodoxin n=1 Tax=Murimonas intestini TaxID=1337051 RepID=UPI0011DD3CB2|nr:EFR1 family ferrodoxin [Murimonas intestini]